MGEVEVQWGALADAVFEAVIFDMDGTLIDSTPAVERSWTQWAIEYELTAEQLAGHHGYPAAGIVDKLIPAERRAAALARISELELADTHDIGTLPGAAEAFVALQRRRFAIATSCTAPLAAARLAASALSMPPVLVTVDDVERGKPAPDPFLVAAERLGADPARCLVVEDAVSGLTGARAAGCASLAVVTTTPADLLANHADAVVPDLSYVTWSVSAAGIRLQSA
ncbi:MAG: HAD family hydrolase [Propionibacteriaceae bacterium]